MFSCRSLGSIAPKISGAVSDFCRQALQLSHCNAMQAVNLKAARLVNKLQGCFIQDYKPSAALADGTYSSFIHRKR